MNPLLAETLDNMSYQHILENVTLNEKALSMIGLSDVGKAYMIAKLTSDQKKSAVVVCSNSFTANKMLQDLKFFSDLDIVYFPAKKLQYYDIEAENKDFANLRLETLEKMQSKSKHIVVTTIDALLMKMLPRKKMISESMKLKVGDSISLSDFAQKLTHFGFERYENVEGKGQFAIRGGILDVFPIQSEFPYRLELFGDEIDQIRTFDVMTQRSLDTVNEMEIGCAREGNLDKIDLDSMLEQLRKTILENKTMPEALKENIRKDIGKIEQNQLENVLDKYFSLAVSNYETIMDYMDDHEIYFDEPLKLEEKEKNICYENLEMIKILAQKEYVYIPFVNQYLTYEDVLKRMQSLPCMYLQMLEIDKKLNQNRKCFYFDIKEASFYRDSMEVLLNDIQNAKQKKIMLVFPSEARVKQIKNYLSENHIPLKMLEKNEKSLKKGMVYITQGILSSGFSSEELGILLIAESISGVNYVKEKPKKLQKSTLGKKINTYADLEEGDYVVHVSHGIGIYRGVQTISVQGVTKDYIKLEYSNGGILYVPINQLDSVGKYVCDDEAKPKINSLGTSEWEKTRSKVQKHVQEIAKDLVLLYARREKAKGFAFQKDTPWQKEFEDSFQYELTPDQKTSLQEIKKDMEEEKPMDRLLCGDVGYGKTELALRAAFKAVMSGKQVAYLVPTTVLSLQQYKTFYDRMTKFGIKVEMLNRFRSAKEQKEILKGLIDGKIDVVVGTHRLLSKDVFFKDLGFLIIDEEHRFGVKDKEKIKELKETIDVLSMTATPIPRTLHMSLIGIRQMSTLTEPPIERLPVHTYVVEYNDALIQNAIENELARDGQVIYLNNRVNELDDVVLRVRKLVPNARIGVAHGKMSPVEIENAMLHFMNHDMDLIVCTTIFESGIDIPNANTIIVEDSDRLGLAQLYQIRGRVGRSNRLAYAYITYQKNKQISEVSEKRLKAIKDFTEFGSGFKIALRDLEIRGSGNLLGKEQHGHMAKVGYEMYLNLLEKAIQEEKMGKNVSDLEEIQKEVKMDIEVSAYISDRYIKDPIQKILMYQEISDIQSKEDSLDVIDELIDRYGDVPRETENLIKIVEIRNEARKLGITRIIASANVIKFEPLNTVIRLTNPTNGDILVHVQLEINKLKSMLEEKR